jgi:hypothetical protein
MKVSEAEKCFLIIGMNSKKNTLRNYQLLLSSFSEYFGDRELDTLRGEEILTFLIQFTEGTKQSTK